MVTRLAWMAHKLVSSKRLTREASEASWRATVPGLYLWGFLTPPVAGADLRAALVANCFLGALPPVQFVVKMTINFLGLPVSLEKSSQDTHSSDPHSLLTGSSIFGTLPLTKSTVAPLATCFIISTNSRPRVNSNRLLDHETILDKFPDVLP